MGVDYDLEDATVGLVAGLDIQSCYYWYKNVRYSGYIYSVVQTDKKINMSIYSASFLFASVQCSVLEKKLILHVMRLLRTSKPQL